MKKITLLLFGICLSLTGHAQLSEDFESATFPPTGWTTFIGENGLGTIENWKYQNFDGNGTAVCNWEAFPAGQRSEDWLVTPQFTVSSESPLLFFDGIDSSTIDYGSIYTVRVSTTSQTTHSDFTIIDTQDESQIYHSKSTMAGSTRAIDLSSYIGQSIYVAFVLEQNNGDLWRIDNVMMGSAVNAPNPVTTPSPADGAVDVFVDPSDFDADGFPDKAVTIGWTPATTGDAATAYDVYLGNSPTSLNLLGTTPNNIVDITGMNYSSQYYWKIIAKNSGGEATGSVTWSFTTEDNPNLGVDQKEVTLFSVSPNPVNDRVQIITQASIDKIIVTNPLGQRTLSIDGNKLNGNMLDMSSLNAGMYFISVTAGNKTETVKVIKH